jgi:small basic protein (TIGR04137 family)
MVVGRDDVLDFAQKVDHMSLDRSLKVASNMSGKRSVLTRAERVSKMKADKKFNSEKDGVLGIPKTLVGKTT